MVVPFVVALMLNSQSLRGSSLFRVLIFLPYVVPVGGGGPHLARARCCPGPVGLNQAAGSARLAKPAGLVELNPNVIYPGAGFRRPVGHRRLR